MPESIRIFLFLVLIALFSASCAKKEDIGKDRSDKTDYAVSSESIGKYTAGCVKNPAELPETGRGYQVIRLHRERYFGHQDLISFIRNIAGKINRKYDTVLYIADLSKINGGPILDDHSSHQIGLDADILFIHKPVSDNKLLSPSARDSTHPVSTLNRTNSDVDPEKWSPVNEKILMEVSRNAEVDRIFVNPAIKKRLCDTYPGEEWLRKIRPWWGHDGHFHVRLGCPDNSPECAPGPAIPEGTGCGQDLAWWFSDDAKRKRAEIARAPSKTEKDIDLPSRCYDILY